MSTAGAPARRALVGLSYAKDHAAPEPQSSRADTKSRIIVHDSEVAIRERVGVGEGSAGDAPHRLAGA